MKYIANGLADFVSGNGIWIVIGCLGLAFLVSIIFLILNIQKAKRASSLAKESSVIQKEEPVIIEEEIKEPENVYSITHDEKTDEWIVKKTGASRATKRCKTEKEAIDLVNKLKEK